MLVLIQGLFSKDLDDKISGQKYAKNFATFGAILKSTTLKVKNNCGYSLSFFCEN